MKINSLHLNLFILVFSMFLFTSCSDKKSEQKQETKQENVAVDGSYQCPMDCEKGKTYHQAGSCPVCKMDLAMVDASDEMTCEQHKDGKCSCEGTKCKCENCAEHTKAMTCNQHEDGKCTCEGEKCECANCPEHS